MFRIDTHQRIYRRLDGTHSTFNFNVFFPPVKLATRHTCGLIYANRIWFKIVYPIETQTWVHEILASFIHDRGIPHELHSDGGLELIQGGTRKRVEKYEIHTTITKPDQSMEKWIRERGSSNDNETYLDIHYAVN